MQQKNRAKCAFCRQKSCGNVGCEKKKSLADKGNKWGVQLDCIRSLNNMCLSEPPMYYGAIIV